MPITPAQHLIRLIPHGQVIGRAELYERSRYDTLDALDAELARLVAAGTLQSREGGYVLPAHKHGARACP